MVEIGYIEGIIEKTYREYGYDARGKVAVLSEEKIIISLNNENPCLGRELWDFIRTLDEEFKILGYKRDKAECNYNRIEVKYVR